MTQYADILKDVAMAFIAVFLLTAILLVMAGASPVAAYYHIIKGALGSWSRIAHVIKVWIPLTLCACGVLYTFKIGLWNIGVEGQVIAGAICATAVLRCGVQADAPFYFFWLSFPAGIAGGAIWALAAGFLKTKGGVHEIFGGLGLNFVAQGITLWLIFGPWKQAGTASMSGTAVFPKSLWMPYLPSLHISPACLVFVLTGLVFTAVFLGHTRTGLGFKAIGSNRDAAFLFGLKPDRFMILAMVFAGGFAGLAGSVQVSGVYHRLIPSISSNYGYLALLVVMLSNYNVWITPAVALFFACLNTGSIQLPMMLRIDSSFAGVIQGGLVMALLALHGWRIRQRHLKKAEEG